MFKALNAVETLLAIGLVVTAVVVAPPTLAAVAGAVAVAVLLVQLGAVRPLLTRRSNAALAGSDAPRSHAHLVYVALEVVKVAALVVAGVALLGS
ncbi:MAG: hypothetical protein J0I34_19460 [Pseudonocardia sp.]|uniref:hypothetical protein n=1 Tax=unclassified Pseudonocardia TaxID=2619320 RepID=UPI001ACF6DDC|nr:MULTISPECIES: hypothetical protein [unclassified Pseudonocardia]MBN9110946.1 hypothetical protein [Pseudonocardia sp.]